jgi:hypothetical protein
MTAAPMACTKGRNPMNRRTLAWVVVAVMIAIVLGGASWIVVTSDVRPGEDAPSGFMH